MNTKNKYSKITLANVKKSPIVKMFIKSADNYLGEIGYTEHGKRHVSLVASIAKTVLLRLGYSKRYQELAEIAGYMHDIGNIVNRHDHGQSSALIAMRLLKDLMMDPEEIALIISAIGNHEQTGDPMNPIAAALVLADKSDVHKTRVRSLRRNALDHNIHERVNYAVKKSSLEVNKDKKIISLYLVINIQKFSVMEYFEIFMDRMHICKRAAEDFFDCAFELIINERQLL
ncbi:MAG: HD domain-containing protein [Endomicrobium sp.]|nr:HD domain-containing protein [Endomicrobium sp.]